MKTKTKCAGLIVLLAIWCLALLTGCPQSDEKKCECANTNVADCKCGGENCTCKGSAVIPPKDSECECPSKDHENCNCGGTNCTCKGSTVIPPKDPECECPVKEHLNEGETCNCGGINCNCTLKPKEQNCECVDKAHLGVGEECCKLGNCACTLKIYGSFTDNAHNVIRIYRKGEVSDAEMTQAVTNTIKAYNDLNIPRKASFAGKVDEIHIVPNSYEPSYFYRMENGKKVFGFRHGVMEATINALLGRIAYETMQLE